jgi:hypothetical protein
MGTSSVASALPTAERAYMKMLRPPLPLGSGEVRNVNPAFDNGEFGGAAGLGWPS